MVGNEDCIFCKIVRKEIETEMVYENDNFVAIRDIKPLVEGHSLVIPKGHYRNLLDMPVGLGNEMLDAVKKVSLDLIKKGKAEGINIVSNNEAIADQLVFHTHVHIIPRNPGDNVRILKRETK